jgi:hypothetical protein
MKKNFIQRIGLFTFIAGSIALMSCSIDSLTGQTVKESRDVSGFTGVALAFSGNVYVTQGNQFKVEIEADKGVMDVLLTELHGDVLVFKTKNGVWRNLGQVKAYVTMPEINELSVSGSGDMICESAVSTNEIGLSVSGSGSLKLNNLSAREVDADVTGSGDILINGRPAANSELDARITGSGNIKADGYPVEEVSVQITGSGSAAVNAVKELETTITGSGSVNYKGNPLVNANATGSGHTRSMN